MSFVSLYLYVPDEGSLLPKYRDCTTSNDFESYIYIYIYFGFQKFIVLQVLENIIFFKFYQLVIFLF